MKTEVITSDKSYIHVMQSKPLYSDIHNVLGSSYWDSIGTVSFPCLASGVFVNFGRERKFETKAFETSSLV